MIFKRKGFMALALLSLGFLCFTFHASALHYDMEARYGISWDTGINGRGEERIVFGRMHPQLEAAHRTNGEGLLKSTIIDICKQRGYPKTIVFDGIEYDYNEATETLTVAQIGESKYATAQQFAIAALGLNNIDEMDRKLGEIKDATMKQLAEEHLIDALERDERKARQRYSEIQAEKAEKKQLPKLVTKPLEAVIIVGNIIRIGDDFCNGHDHRTDLPIVIPPQCDHFPQLKTIDLSNSNVREICVGAFPGCPNLARFIPPASGSLKRISAGAFEGTPLKIYPLPTEYAFSDPRRPINELPFLCPGCTIL